MLRIPFGSRLVKARPATVFCVPIPQHRAVRLFAWNLCRPAILIALFTFASAPSHASSRPLPQQSLQTTAELVKVDVSVADAHGNLLAGLTPKDFRILDNGAEQPITFFVPVDAPAQVLVMMETGPAVYLIHDQHLAAAYSLLDGLNPDDQVGLVTYDQSPRRILAFTGDKSSLLSALSGVDYNLGMGELNFYGSLLEVLDWLQSMGGKRAIVLLSTGLDSLQPSRWESLVDKLRRDDIVIFPIALGGSLRSVSPPKSRSSKKNRSGQGDASASSQPADSPVSFAKADRDLRALAAMTGGAAYFPQSRDDFVSIYRQIAAALRHQYVLGFVPSHDGQYHSLSVDLTSAAGHLPGGSRKKVEYRVFARAGYLAPAP